MGLPCHYFTSAYDTELSAISSLTLTQHVMTDGGGSVDGFSFAAITSGAENVGTRIDSEGQTIVMQVTMVSPFYLRQSVPQPVDVTGEVILKLAGGAQARRRLVVTGDAAQAGTAKNTEMASARALGEAGSSFELEVQLSQINNESQDGSTAFGFVHIDTSMMGFVLSVVFWMVAVAAI
jgi:hypothetical protein